jgi:hypothetical protein
MDISPPGVPLPHFSVTYTLRVCTSVFHVRILFHVSISHRHFVDRIRSFDLIADLLSHDISVSASVPKFDASLLPREARHLPLHEVTSSMIAIENAVFILCFFY